MVTVVPITVDLIEAFKAVRLRALQDAPSAFGSTYARESQFSPEEWLVRVRRWSGERGIGLMAMEDDAPCGLAGALMDDDDRSRASLVSMWTAPSHRHHGVGGMLVKAVLDWARLRGVRTVNLMVVSTNDAAIRFYLGLGFAMTGRTEPYPNDPALHEHEMAVEFAG